MKNLFIVQDKDREHLTQAQSLKNMLEGYGHEVVAVIAGLQSKSKAQALDSIF